MMTEEISKGYHHRSPVETNFSRSTSFLEPLLALILSRILRSDRIAVKSMISATTEPTSAWVMTA